MAFDTLTKAIRLLVGRRYTSTDLTDSQEAFASTIQMGTSEIWSQINLIPSASLPYSSSATPGTTTTSGVLKYWYRWPLTVANNTATGSSVWYFTSPTGSVAGIGSQLIDSGQQINFISPKYVSDSNIVNQSADAGNNGNPPGYNIALFTSADGVTFSPLSPSASYQFDYKSGILTFTTTTVPSNRVYATVYQYVGRMLSDPNDIVTLNITSSNISASGYISSSEANFNTLTSDSSILFNVTASNISASNYISASTLNSNDLVSTNNILTNITSSNISASGYVSSSFVDTNTLTSINNILTNITSSNISASGYLSASTLNSNDLVSTNNILINVTASNISASGYISGSDGWFNTLNVSSSINNIGTLSVTGSTTLTDTLLTNLTASNISASGFITASSIYDTGELIVLGNTKLGDDVNDTIQITGSTNISGSLTVTGLTTLETLNLNNISASGWITASSLNIVGNSVLNTITGSLSGSSISTGNAIIDGGFINNTPIGNVTPSTGIFTNITASNISASTFTSSIQNGVGFFGTSSWSVSSSYSDYAATAGLSQNAQDILVYVKNTSGAIIPKGKVVRIAGADSSANFGTIGLADWINDDNSANTLGFTNESFSINGFGYVMTEGYLTGVNTGDFTSGDLLYLSSSGTYTNIVPIAPKHGVRLGQTIRSQQNNGSIYVRIDNGAELGELHDVIDSTTTSSYGDLLVKSGSIWINSKNLTGSYTLSGSLNVNTASFNTLTVTGNSALNTVTASSISASGNITGNSLTVTGNSLFYGDLTVYGSSSIVNISSSTVIIGDNRIQLNAWSTGSFSQRYAGLDLTDSGSNNNITSSLLWDSLNNYWVLTNNQSGPTPIVTSSALILQGPVSEFGSEKQLQQNNFLKVETTVGNLTSSNLYEVNNELKYNGTISSSAISASSAFFNLDVLINGVLKVFGKIYAYAGIIGDVTGSLSGSSIIVNTITASVITSSTVRTGNAQIDGGNINNTVIGNITPSTGNFTYITASVISSSTLISNNNTLVNVTSSNISASGYISGSSANFTNLSSVNNILNNITSSNISASGYITGSNVYVENTITSDTGSFIYLNINNTGSAPTSYTDSGMPGEIRFDNNFIYIYTNNIWVRTPIVRWTT